MSTYQPAAVVPLGGVRTAAKAVAVILAIAAAVAVVLGAVSHDSAKAAIPAGHASVRSWWTPAQALEAYEAYQITANQGGLAEFGRDWQMSAYRSRAELADGARAAAHSMTVWSDQIAAGRWSPEVRPLAVAAAAEGRAISTDYAKYAALPTKAAMNHYRWTVRSMPAAQRLRDALRA